MEYVNYFAYGSNMLAKVISSRRGISYAEKVVGFVEGWRLVFNCPGVNKYEPAFANIEESTGEVVYGVVYTLSHREFASLLKTEGNMYEIIQLPVRCGDCDILCKTLISKDTVLNKRPSLRYLNLLKEGASENSLAPNYISMLSMIEHEPTPPGYEFVTKLVAIYLRVRFFIQKRKSV